MTNEQLTQEVMNLKEHLAEAKGEHESFRVILNEIQEEVKSTKALAEDVHIMAINMQNMQKAQEEANKKIEETNNKVDALSTKEFVEYKETKKTVKQKIIGEVIGFVLGIILTFLALKLGLKEFL